MGNYKILCIMTYGRAGSKLFHSFLDWHPQIMCFPRTFQFNEFWKRVRNRESDQEHLVDSFIRTHPRFFSGRSWDLPNIKYDKADRLGPNMDETFEVDVEIFRKKALAELNGTITRQALFIALHRAYHAACGRELPKDPLVLYHIHAIEFVEDLNACVEDFGNDTHLLVITRHPIWSLKSLVEVMKVRNTLACGEVFFQQCRILRNVRRIAESLPNLNMRYLTFEQILLHHRDVMKAFVNWVGMEWHDSLMMSTMHGKLWWGNGQVPRNGISPGWKVYEPAGILEKKDWAIFRTLLFRRMKKLGYIDRPGYERRLRKTDMLFFILLPTAAEWASLKAMLSFTHWFTTAKKIRENIDDGLSEPSALPREMLKHLRVLNPLKWLWYVLRRILYYYMFALKDTGRHEKIPRLLLEETYTECKPRGYIWKEDATIRAK